MQIQYAQPVDCMFVVCYQNGTRGKSVCHNMKILCLKNHVMILGGERERTKGSPLTRMDQLRRICLSRYSEYPQYFPVQEQVLFTIHNILQRILVDQDLCPDLQQRDRYSRDFRLNGRGLRSTPTECVTYGAKSNMSNRYFDWTRNCFKHMIFKRTFEFFEELAIKMKKKKKCDTIYKIS